MTVDDKISRISLSLMKSKKYNVWNMITQIITNKGILSYRIHTYYKKIKICHGREKMWFY